MVPLRRVPQQNGERFHCEYENCGRSFIRKEHLRRHLRNHDPSQIVTCQYCSRTFSRSDVLRRHESSYHKAESRTTTGRKSDLSNSQCFTQSPNASQLNNYPESSLVEHNVSVVSSFDSDQPSETVLQSRAMSVFGDSVSENVAYDDDVWWLLRPSEEPEFVSPPQMIYSSINLPVNSPSTSSSGTV